MPSLIVFCNCNCGRNEEEKYGLALSNWFHPIFKKPSPSRLLKNYCIETNSKAGMDNSTKWMVLMENPWMIWGSSHHKKPDFLCHFHMLLADLLLLRPIWINFYIQYDAVI